MPVDPFTPEQQTRLARMEAAPPVDIAADVREAERVEAIARAMWESERAHYVRPVESWEAALPSFRRQYRRLARAAISADPGPDTADQLRQRVHELADRHERSAAHRERLAARWTDAERHQLADAFRRLAHQSRVEALRVRAVAGPRPATGAVPPPWIGGDHDTTRPGYDTDHHGQRRDEEVGT